MLPAGRRLRRSRDFTSTVRGGRRAGSPHRLLVAHLYVGTPAPVRSTGEASPLRCADLPADPSLGGPRSGFIVSRAVGGAVVRATVKRRLRHLVATRLDALPAGSALVVRALPASAHADSVALGADLDAALTRLLGSAGRS